MSTQPRRSAELIETLPCGFAELDRSFRYVAVNRNAEELLGFPRAELLGQSIWQLLPEAKAGADLEPWLRAQDGVACELAPLYVSGTHRWVQISLRPLEGGLVAYFQDVTARREAAETQARLEAEVRHLTESLATLTAQTTLRHELQPPTVPSRDLQPATVSRLELPAGDLVPLLHSDPAMDACTVFLIMATHELNTPLTSLGLELETLLRAHHTGRLEHLAPGALGAKLSSVDRHRRRLARLVERLLDVSRLAAGEMELSLEPVDLAQAVHAATAGAQEILNAAGCQVMLEADTPIVGLWDRARLEQLARELLENAVRFGAGKPIRVTVEDHGHFARLMVRDGGPGIPLEHQARIFEPFERACSPRHHAGLGLGLWVVRQIAEALQGEVRVLSQLGEGATFMVDLPRQGAEEILS